MISRLLPVTDPSSGAPVTLSYTIEDDDGAESSAVATVSVPTPYEPPESAADRYYSGCYESLLATEC